MKAVPITPAPATPNPRHRLRILVAATCWWLPVLLFALFLVEWPLGYVLGIGVARVAGGYGGKRTLQGTFSLDFGPGYILLHLAKSEAFDPYPEPQQYRDFVAGATWHAGAGPFPQNNLPAYSGPLSKLGFGFVSDPAPRSPPVLRWYRYSIWIPSWLPLPPLGLLTWRRLARRALQRNRRALGLCLACGYDLRGSPDRCPECGATVSADTRRPQPGRRDPARG